MNLTTTRLRDTLRNLGAVGHANARPRDEVIAELTRFGADLGADPVRRLKIVAAETRSAEALAFDPRGAVLYCANGLYLPHRIDSAAARDFAVCAEFREANLGETYSEMQRLKAVSDAFSAAAGQTYTLDLGDAAA